MFVFFFFFQAEDGIRYLVRSRGLGDVYKRQILFDLVELPLSGDAPAQALENIDQLLLECLATGDYEQVGYVPVSYTHLTLPTSDLV